MPGQGRSAKTPRCGARFPRLKHCQSNAKSTRSSTCFLRFSHATASRVELLSDLQAIIILGMGKLLKAMWAPGPVVVQPCATQASVHQIQDLSLSESAKLLLSRCGDGAEGLCQASGHMFYKTHRFWHGCAWLRRPRRRRVFATRRMSSATWRLTERLLACSCRVLEMGLTSPATMSCKCFPWQIAGDALFAHVSHVPLCEAETIVAAAHSFQLI